MIRGRPHVNRVISNHSQENSTMHYMLELQGKTRKGVSARLEGRMLLSVRNELRQGFRTKVMSSRKMPEFPFFLRLYLFIFREGKGGRKREISMCGCLSRGPHWGPGPQPRHMSWLGIEPTTLWFAARAQPTGLCQPGPEFPFSRMTDV